LKTVKMVVSLTCRKERVSVYYHKSNATAS